MTHLYSKIEYLLTRDVVENITQDTSLLSLQFHYNI